MKPGKNSRYLEIVWLMVALLSLMVFIHALFTRGVKNSLSFFIIFVLAGAIFLLRRNNRLKYREKK